MLLAVRASKSTVPPRFDLEINSLSQCYTTGSFSQAI